MKPIVTVSQTKMFILSHCKEIFRGHNEDFVFSNNADFWIAVIEKKSGTVEIDSVLKLKLQSMSKKLRRWQIFSLQRWLGLEIYQSKKKQAILWTLNERGKETYSESGQTFKMELFGLNDRKASLIFAKSYISDLCQSSEYASEHIVSFTGQGYFNNSKFKNKLNQLSSPNHLGNINLLVSEWRRWFFCAPVIIINEMIGSGSKQALYFTKDLNEEYLW